MKIGILALQGAVHPHEEKLQGLGVTPVQVRRTHDLDGLSGIILPGGESTTMLHLLELNALWEPLQRFTSEYPTWGVCAGTILLAKRVEHPGQKSLAQLDITAERNAYGRQNESFVDAISGTAKWSGTPQFEGIFIRAPRIRNVGSSATVLFHHRDEPVMVEEKHLLASTFHPELTDSSAIHEYFISKCHG